MKRLDMLVSWNRLIILKCFGLFYLAGITSDKQFVYSYHDTFVPPLGLRATRLNVSSFSRLGRWEAKPTPVASMGFFASAGIRSPPQAFYRPHCSRYVSTSQSTSCEREQLSQCECTRIVCSSLQYHTKDWGRIQASESSMHNSRGHGQCPALSQWREVMV